MSTQNRYQHILDSYPEYITKDQMYRICQISKRTCLFLLESGLVPNIDSGKRTRRFKIKTTDVVAYLQQREHSPSLFRPPNGYYSKKQVSSSQAFSSTDIDNMRSFYSQLLQRYPDVMMVADVASFTGYHRNSVVIWCSKGYLKSYLVRQKYLIPKEYLLDFLQSDHFISIAVQSNKHKWFNEQIRRMAK